VPRSGHPSEGRCWDVLRTAPPTSGLTSALVLAATLALVPAASAFESLPGGPHDEITSAAARESGFPDTAVDALVQAVRAVDIRDNALEPSATRIDRIDATGDYRPQHHCDRVPDASDLEEFNATAAYVANRSDAAVAVARADDAHATIRILGELLHAVQDCLSHSNAVDLEDPQAVVHAINSHAAAPAGLRLTGFQPGAEDAERPPGDPYPHGDYAKDSGDKNDEARLVLPDGRTKYEASRDLAIEASILALQDVLSQLDATQVAALGGVQGGGQPIPRVGIPAPTWVAAVAVLAAVAGVVAARRR
jgi:hypothetical protein